MEVEVVYEPSPFPRQQLPAVHVVYIEQPVFLPGESDEFSLPVCFSVKPKGYNLFLQMGHACDGTATIYLGKHTATDTFVAIRKIPLEECSVEIEQLQDEIKMHRIFNCDHVLNYHATFLSGKTLWIVMPLQGYGSCMDIIQAHFVNGLPEAAIALVIQEVLKALVYLHDCGVIHRSVRASHVLVSEKGKVSLSGLRSCYVLEKHGLRENKCWQFPNASVKSLNYHSPEILKQDLHGYDVSSDIYSVGILACELANGYTPFSNLQPADILYAKLDGNTPHLLDRSTLPQSPLDEQNLPYQEKQFSAEFHDFVSCCLIQEPSVRPTASQLLQHDFIRSVRKIPLSRLPAMLSPVTPLTESALKTSEDLGNMASLAHNFSRADLCDDFWSF